MTNWGDTRVPKKGLKPVHRDSADCWDLAACTTRTLNIYLQMKGVEERGVWWWGEIGGLTSSRKVEIKMTRVQFESVFFFFFKVSHNSQCRCGDANAECPDPNRPIGSSE